MKQFNTLFGLIVILLCLTARVHSAECGRFPEKENFISPENPAWKGSYQNFVYGYSVTLPEGIVAYSDPPPNPQHGIGIVLSWEPISYICVDSSYNSAEYETATEAAMRLIKYIKSDGGIVKKYRIDSAVFSDFRGVQIKINYVCPKTKEERIDLTFVSLERGVLDTIAITTTKSRYDKDRLILSAIASGWRNKWVTGKNQ